MPTHVSFSWVDPHFVGVYERREKERLAEKLAATLIERAESEPSDRIPSGTENPR